MFATLTLRRSVPVSLPAWGVIGGLSLAVGLVGGTAPFSGARATRAKANLVVEQIAFDRLIQSTATVPLGKTLDASAEAMVGGGVAAIVHAGESEITLFDARTGKPIASLGPSADSGKGQHSPFAISPADSGRWAVLDRRRRSVDVVTPKGVRQRSIALPRGVWSGVAWDDVRRRVVVTGLELGRPKAAVDGRSIHEFDERGVEVSSYRDVAPIAHRLQASFNMPFAAIDGPVVLSGSSLSNEIVVFDRSAATERLVRVADDWFRPIDWELPPQTSAPKSVAEPTMTWLSRQTMLTAVMPLSRGRFIARFTQHAADRDRYVYALVDSAGQTRSLTRATTVRLAGASGDTVSGVDIGADGIAHLFVGLVRSF